MAQTKARREREFIDRGLRQVVLREVGSNQRLLSAHGQPCPYCTRTMDRGSVKLQPTSDHIRAKSKMNRGEPGRTIVVCSECNFMKNTLTLEEFITALAVKNEQLLHSVDNNISRMQSIRYLLNMGLEE